VVSAQRFATTGKKEGEKARRKKKTNRRAPRLLDGFSGDASFIFLFEERGAPPFWGKNTYYMFKTV
jgi:hypothetical protein